MHTPRKVDANPTETRPSAQPTIALRALIVDDEGLARKMLRVALESTPDVEVVGECGTADEAVRLIASEQPDLVVLDIHLPGDGFSVVDRVGPDRMPLVVFVTAFDQHAVRAFATHALDYVLKPFSADRIGEAVTRARAELEAANAVALSQRLRALLLELGPATNTGADDALEPCDALPGPDAAGARPLARLAVRKDDKYFFIRCADIDWFEGSGNYVLLHVRDQQHRVRLSLRALTQALDPVRFRRVHRSAIVNVERIREVQPWFGGDFIAILHDGQKLRVSRTFAPTLLRTMQ